MKLNLGCGGQIKSINDPDWIDIDLYMDHPNVKKVDMKNLDFIEDNSVDEIELIHSAEHLGKFEYKEAFKEWYRVLKHGGVLRINVPDLLWIAKQLIEHNGDLDANPGCTLRDCIFGDHSGPGQYHMTGFTKTSITKDLKEVGFSEVNVQEGFWHNEQLCIDVRAKK